MSASARNIGALALASAERRPDDVAVRGPDGELSYGALAQLSGRIARALGELGVKPGDRVGVRMPKSARAVAALQGVVRAGAVYVPVDPIAPAARARMVLDDCAVSAIVGDAGARALASASDAPSVPLLCLDDDGVASLAALPASVPHDMSARAGGDLAYILYTSGSTGKPKGVCLSHDNALAFVDWAVRAVDARASDRFASHAPFHFDLSVLDLYGAFSVGARVCLIPEGAAYIAPALVDFMVREEISLWYSVPSALMLMMEQAALLETRPASLRTVIFAGEPFPIKPLRALRRAWPSVALWNFYGPTETNVCTAARIDRIHDDDTAVPIGAVASGDRAWARMDDGAVAGEGQEGELVVDGPTVF
ncbi:MAG TPA: AMP-binding protein, partial [Myxococcota bacterium]